MPVKNKPNPLAAALGTTFAISLTASPITNAADNPFSAYQLTNGGYEVAEEGSCGDKMKEGACGDKKTEGSCGDKKAEGKCGEGKCGDNK